MRVFQALNGWRNPQGRICGIKRLNKSRFGCE
mgnify:CR=1 FL=1